MARDSTQVEAEAGGLWSLSLIVSVATVISFFVVANVLMGRNGLPLGGDPNTSYVPWINQALAMGPLQFAQSRNFIEVLYPIIGSYLVQLGMTADQFEIFAPILMAVAAVGGTAYLARDFIDQRVGVLTVAFAAGWFAIYRMGADYHGQFFAFCLLLPATGLLVRITRTKHLPRDLALFGVFVALATFAHVETTAIFVAVWVLTFAAFGLKAFRGAKRLLTLVALSIMIAIPVLYELPTMYDVVTTSLPYPELPTFWVQVLGPELILVFLGLAVCAYEMRKPECDLLTKLVFVWTVLSFVVLSGWYVFQSVNLAVSDRTFLMLPVPLLSAKATVWLGERGGLFTRYQSFLTVLILVVPVVTAPTIFAYLVPERFRYYPPF